MLIELTEAGSLAGTPRAGGGVTGAAPGGDSRGDVATTGGNPTLRHGRRFGAGLGLGRERRRLAERRLRWRNARFPNFLPRNNHGGRHRSRRIGGAGGPLAQFLDELRLLIHPFVACGVDHGHELSQGGTHPQQRVRNPRRHFQLAVAQFREQGFARMCQFPQPGEVEKAGVPFDRVQRPQDRVEPSRVPRRRFERNQFGVDAVQTLTTFDNKFADELSIAAHGRWQTSALSNLNSRARCHWLRRCSKAKSWMSRHGHSQWHPNS